MSKQPKVVKYTGKDGRWYWRCVAANGRTIMDGAEGYNRESDLDLAIHRNAASLALAITSERIVTGKPRRK